MILIVGLGNPGEKYANHRHNVGFMALDHIASRHGASAWRKKFQGETAELVIEDTKCLLLKPTTYMNDSGLSVAAAANFYKISLDNIIVIHDELDLKPGKIRVKTGGGNAGHNGLKSIAAHLSSDFRRLRIGIGHPGNKDLVSSYVLHDFSKTEKQWLAPLLEAIADTVGILIKGNDAKFVSDVSQQVHKDDKPKSRTGNTDQTPAKPENKQDRPGQKPKTQSKEPKRETGLAEALKAWIKSKNDT